MFTQSINFYTFAYDILKECICYKNVIHIGRNKWLVRSAFQQGLRESLSWFLF